MQKPLRRRKKISAFTLGVLLVLLLHLLFVLGTYAIFNHPALSSDARSRVQREALFGLGLLNLWILQAMYVGPLVGIFRWQGKLELVKGMYGASIVTLFINWGTCFTFPVAGVISGITSRPAGELIYGVGLVMFMLVAVLSFLMLQSLLQD